MAETNVTEGAAPQPAEPAPADARSLDEILAEFDSAAARAGQQLDEDTEPAEVSAPPQTPDDGADVETRLEAMRRWASGVELERLQAREDADAATVIARGREAIAEFEGLPEDYAERFLYAEYLVNPELREAWDSRHASEATAARCERVVQRALNSLRNAARRVPNREATEDRMLVAHAVRGASGKAFPSAPPNYSSMPNGEFSEAVKKQFGFDPGV